MTVHNKHNTNILKILLDTAPPAVLKAAKSKTVPKSILETWTTAVNQNKADFRLFRKSFKKMPDHLTHYVMASCGLDLSKKWSHKDYKEIKTVGEGVISALLKMKDSDQPVKKSFDFVIEDKRISAGFRLLAACANGRLDAVKSLITQEKANPGAIDNGAIEEASIYGHTPIVAFLLQDDRVDPSVHNQMALCSACEEGHTEVVSLLLKHKKVNPSIDNQMPLRDACREGHLEVAKLLLADSRVDPSVHQQQALYNAVDSGKIDLVALLLNDQRIDPTMYGNLCLKNPVEKGDLQMIQLLLKDPRIKPSKEYEQAIRKLFTDRFGAIASVGDLTKLEIKSKL